MSPRPADLRSKTGGAGRRRLLRYAGAAVEARLDRRGRRGIDGEVGRIDAPGAAGTGEDLRAARDRDGCPGGLDRAARFSGRRPGVESAADVDLACLHAGEQRNRAVVILDCLRLYDPRVVDGARQQTVFRSRRHDDLAAIGFDQLSILGEVIQRAPIHLYVDQLPSAEGERLGAACGQRHCAELRANDAAVRDSIAEEGNITALGGSESSVVDDAPGARAAEGAAVASRGWHPARRAS